jgi:hypothetical protein
MVDEPKDDDNGSFVGSRSADELESKDAETKALVESNALLQSNLASERDERLEERFYWVLVVTILFDVIAISAIDSSSLFILIFVLQLVALFGFANMCGVDWAVRFISLILEKLIKRLDRD